MKRLLPLLALPLAACSSASSPAPTLFSAVDPTPVSSVAAVAPIQAGASGLLQMSADAGPVLQVRERETANGFHQDLILAYAKEGHPENRIEVDVVTKPKEKGVGKPTEAGIRSEILSRYPGVPMKIVLKPKENGLGTFGLAIGVRGDGARCMFAWQWVDDLRDARATRSGFAKMMGHSTPASVRVAMCRRDMTLDALAGLVESLSVANDVDLDKVIAANSMTRGTSTGQTRSNGMVADLSPSLESLVGAKQPVAAEGEQPKKVRRAKRPAEKDVAAKRAAPEQTTVTQTTFGVADSGGLRYMAPVANAASVYPRAAGYTGAAATTASTALDPTLPPQAYRGPSSR
ncbi:MAG: cellulose biosynthesis protein BcsN [Methylobacteriaceae bacterium]|nr:cellulose biosynthesis protein BcsN [Methylobacteriaceae bacterium]